MHICMCLLFTTLKFKTDVKLTIIVLILLILQMLRNLTRSREERETLSEVASMLTPLQNKLKVNVQNAGPAAKQKPG